MLYRTIIEIIRNQNRVLNMVSHLQLMNWFVFSAVLCASFADIEIHEGIDFRCVWAGHNVSDRDFINENCYHQYWIQNHKFGIPPYLFIIANVLPIPIVTSIYCRYAESIVNALERNVKDAQGEPRNGRRTLFITYLCHLITRFVLEITFFLSIETELFYPKNFPSHFFCPINTTSFNCYSYRAASKNDFTKVWAAGNGIFAFSAFLEIIWILSRARNGKKFMENWHFYAAHLNRNSNGRRQPRLEEIPLTEFPTIISLRTTLPMIWKDAQPQTDFRNAIHTLKANCLHCSEQLGDLGQPSLRLNPGEGESHDLTMDETNVHVAIHEARAHQYFAKDLDRQKHPPDEKDCEFAKPEDIIDMEHKNVLVVGHPGIGKTSLSIRMLRRWASGEAFNAFYVVFLVKFRRFHDNAKLSLRELLARAETVQRLHDSVWNIIKTKPTKVLLIFDGLDKYSRKKDIKAQKDDSTFKNHLEEKMPFSVLYNKLATGQLLRGASILTTTTPTAVEYVAHVNFRRTVEIRGFTTKNVEDYVEKFTRHVPEAREKVWGHIKSNINIFSLCYIPVNCFLVCSCLLQIFFYAQVLPNTVLPTKITDIYKKIVDMFFLSHNREGCSQEEVEKPKAFAPPENLKSLGEIAFTGIEEGRLLFESSEVSGLEDCGLLHKLPDEQTPPLSDRVPNSQFCFLHLTVQEFFAALHLVYTKTGEEIKNFVLKHIDDNTWQVVLQFVAGLLKGSRSKIFIELLPKSTNKKENRLSSEGEKLIIWPKKDRNLAVKVCKCLYEIDKEQQPELQNKIDKIGFNTVNFSGCSLAAIDLAAVLHFLENAENVLHIDLSSNELGDLSAKDVKKFIVNRKCKLKWLNLSNNKFTDKAVKDLAEALKHSNRKLEKLKIRDNKFTEEGRQCLINAGKHSNCKVVILNCENSGLLNL